MATEDVPQQILAVDDQPTNLEVLARVLGEQGLKIRTVTSGARALEAARLSPPDCILLDVGMPGMDGYAVCGELQADDKLRHIPIIFLTAHDDPEHKVRAFAAGGRDYISKPFQAEEVLARVPFMFADGNHESLSQIFLSRFALPQELSDGESGQGEEWYSFDYGNAHFVVLNDSVSSTTVLTGSEPTWLRADLGKVDRQKTPWIFVMHHQGAYSCASNHGSNLAVRAALQPIYDEFKVDVVWNGHDHDYERSHPIRGFQPGSTEGALATEGADGVPVAESGTIYIVSGGAGASLYGSSTACFHTLKAESVNNYLIVDVDGRMLRVTAYRLDGSVLDQFTYSK